MQNGECKYLGEYFDSHDMFWCLWIGRSSSIYLVSGFGGAATRGESDFGTDAVLLSGNPMVEKFGKLVKRSDGATTV